MRKLIQGGTIVNEGKTFNGTIVIEDNRIAEIITENTTPRGNFDEIVDATGCFVYQESLIRTCISVNREWKQG